MTRRFRRGQTQKNESKKEQNLHVFTTPRQIFFFFKFYDAFVKTTTRNHIEFTKREGLIVGFIINLTVKSPFTLVGR